MTMRITTQGLRSAIGVLLSLGIFVFAFGPARQVFVRAEGASLGFSPANGTFALGRTFTVRVTLVSGGAPGVNAADGAVSFDPTALSVVSVQKENGTFGLWTSDPTFSNSKGTVGFSSGSPTPYTQSGGALLTISFKGLKEGQTELSFTGASVLAADGQGTNVLGPTGKAVITIGPASASPPPESSSAEPTALAESGGVSNAPVAVDISSKTHPDPDKWYSNKNPEFTWKLPPDVSGVSATLTDDNNSNPPRVSEGILETKTFDDMGDGVWYFNIRFKSSAGDWSQTARRKIQIDATPPDTVSLDIQNNDPDVPPVLIMKATDKTSGIDRFEVKVDDREAVVVNPSEIHEDRYTIHPVLPGSHKVTVRALDRAGNAAEVMKQFELSGRAMPDISAFGGALSEGEYLIAQGNADHDAYVSVRIELDNKVIAEEGVKADEDGRWTFVYTKTLRSGSYEVSVKMKTKAGAESAYTPKIPLTVTSAPFIERFGWLLVTLLFVAIGGLYGLRYYERKELARRAAITRREIDEARFKSAAVFAALTEEVEEKLQLLDEATAVKLGVPKMTPTDLLDKFRDAIDISQDTLDKEIDDIQKTIDA